MRGVRHTVRRRSAVPLTELVSVKMTQDMLAEVGDRARLASCTPNELVRRAVAAFCAGEDIRDAARRCVVLYEASDILRIWATQNAAEDQLLAAAAVAAADVMEHLSRHPDEHPVIT